MNSISSEHSKIHQKKLKNLISEQKNEIEKLKINHNKNKNIIRNENDKDIVSLKLNNQEKRINEIKKHEDILQELQKNLEKVKEQTSKELSLTKDTHENRLSDEKRIFSQDLLNLKSKNALLAQEAEQIANSDLKRIKKNLEQDKADLTRSNLEDISQQKANATSKKRLTQNEFLRQQTQETNKYNKKLNKLKTENKKILNSSREKLTSQLLKQEQTQKDALELLKRNNDLQTISEHKIFEKSYQTNIKRNESELQSMLSKKEVLLNELETKLKNRSELVLNRKDDSFYTMGKIDFSVSELNNNKGYEVKIKINEEEAQNIDFKAEKRELRLSLQRSHKFKTQEDGRKDSISKIETYMSKVPVEHIIDPKKVTKSYSNGVLSFKIGLA